MAGDAAEQDTPSEIDSEPAYSVYEVRDETVAYSALTSLFSTSLFLTNVTETGSS